MGASLHYSALVQDMLWSQAFLMSSQPTLNLSYNLTLPFPAPHAPYSLISSTLAVFSSLCMEWMSRYFLS